MPTSTRAVATIALIAVTLAGCASPPSPPVDREVEAAAEVAEAHNGLAYAESGGYTLHVLDRVSGEASQIALSMPALSIDNDERYIYVGDGSRHMEIIDSGVWSVDHGDHAHHYAGPPRSIGTVTAPGVIVAVAGDGRRVAITSADGTVTVLDRRALDDGDIVTIAELPGVLAMPYRDGTVVVDRGAVRLVADDGSDLASLTAPCELPVGIAAVAERVVVACESLVIVVSHDAGAVSALSIATPLVAAIRADDDSGRVAIATRDGGMILLDAATATTTPVTIQNRPAAITPVVDGQLLLALDRAGAVGLYALDGAAVARQALPADARDLVVGDDVAYVTMAGSRTVVELRPSGDGLAARRIRLAVQPHLAVATGR